MRISCNPRNDTIQTISYNRNDHTLHILHNHELWAVNSTVVLHSWCFFHWAQKFSLNLSALLFVVSVHFLISNKRCGRTISQNVRTNKFISRKDESQLFYLCVLENLNRNKNKVFQLNSNDLKLKCILPEKLFKYLIAANLRLFAATINHLKQLANYADPIDIYRWCQNKIGYLFGKQ